ncbi:respiratory chain complex I subunit 1 family protein [Methanothermobacter thermautotrophicus]|jgi:energy-converting hydrogenase A subunit J|uniref:Respiratory chain complex I subunit 1 family protein n=1 Tax=Methanothermobacter thermautotrophicus TaxID=145262 RepID=A0A7J4MVV8_METTF|nr:respiratory chain complex I subunit 1 family protein [Methanothermobacter sp.]HIH64723.1 respiratory chain complex I subunit 1 family protein [Methanothermobacter thermautotrophicus]HOQ18588.1 respiratory chain complex I subunit 1 family protein [Methanothermobacter thermautotrophicus]
MNLMGNIIVNVLIAFLIGSLLLGFQRKVMARIQRRPGPPVIQHLLHTLKFYVKESSFPRTAAMPFYIAIAATLCGIWISAVIIGPVLEGSLLLFFGIYALHKIVEHNAGSSSGSPYGKLSCVRAVFSAAAEMPLFAVLAIIYLQTRTMIISDIIGYQSIHGPLLLKLPLAAMMFFVLILSKAPYSPFSITKGKDIISGYETEHFGVLRGYLMISESIAWYMLLWIFLTVFIGGLSLPLYILGMVIITTITAFINATTPMLNPNHSVAIQVILAFVGIAGSIVLMLVM